MAVTLWEQKTDIWNSLWQTPNSTKFSSSVLTTKVKNVGKKVLKGRIKNLLNPNQTFRAWKLWFGNWTTSFRSVNDSRLTTEINVWDVIVEMNTTWFLDDWYVQIWSDILNYTSKTDTQIEWVTWITTRHDWWVAITQLYEMPSDFDKPNFFYIIQESYRITPVEIPYDKDENYVVYYKIFKSWGKNLLKLAWIQQDSLMQIDYLKIHTDQVDDTDESMFEDEYALDVISMLAAWELAFKYKLPNFDSLLSEAYANLQNMFQYYASETNITRQNIKPKAYWFSSIR